MDDYYRELGQLVRNARGVRSQSELARMAHLSRMAVANIELGRQRVTVDVLDRLARALELAPTALIPRTPPGDAAAILERLRPSERAGLARLKARAGLIDIDDAQG